MRRFRPTRPLVALAVGAALGLSACGNDDKNSTVEDFNAQVTAIQAIGGDIDKAMGADSSGDPAAFNKQLNSLADRTADSRKKVADLDVADDKADERDKLTAALDAGEKQLRAFAKAVTDQDADAAAKAGTALAQAGQDIQTTSNALADAFNAK